MKSVPFAVLAVLSGTLSAQSAGHDEPGNQIPRMVSPAIDVAGKPFSYVSRPTDQISVMHAPAGTEITPEGFLYTGYGELMFFTGIDRKPISGRIRTLERGYLPVVHYTVEHGGIEYRFTVFAASLGPQQDGKNVVNFVRVTLRNPQANRRQAFLTTGWRYQGVQETPYPTGENQFERPVAGKLPGDSNQPGQPFRPEATYSSSEGAYLQDGKAIYFFPESPAPSLRPTLRDYYNLLDLGPVGLKPHLAPQTPAATAEYAVWLNPGEERNLDFKMPLAPIASGDAQLEVIAKASFEERLGQVESFWNSIFQRGIRIDVPEAKVNDTYRTSLINDLMSLNEVGKDTVQTINQLHYHGFYLRDSADFVRMYDTSGYPELGRQVVDFFATKQRDNGNFLSQEGQYDGWGEALWTYAEHYRMTHDKRFAAEVYPRILRAVEWLEPALAADPLHLMPATDVRDNEFVPGHLTGYNFLALDGLRAAQLFAHDLGHHEDEKRFRAIEDRLRAALMKQLEVVAPHGGYIPPSLDPGAAGTDWGNLLSVVPEEQLDAFDPHVTATLRSTQAKYQEGLMTYRQTGQGEYLHHYLTIKNTLTELVRGEQEQVIRELYAVLLHTSSTHAGWEYSIRPWGDRDFSGNLAPHGWFAAEYRNLLRNMMVRERGETLHLLSAVSPEWIGAGKQIVVERAATYLGTVNMKLMMPDATSAILALSVDAKQGYAPKSIVLHVPWFMNVEQVIVDGKPARAKDGTVELSPSSKRVELHWTKRPLAEDAPVNYDTAVQRYQREYRERYEKLTGDRGTN